MSKTPSTSSVGYWRLTAFFLPLAATPFLISSTHNIINAALARLPSPELMLAVFSVVKGFTNALKAPVLISGQMVTAMADSRRSYSLTTGFVWSVAGFFFVLLVALGYTPLGGLFLRHVMGLRDPQMIAIGYRAMRITAFLPLAECLRDSSRGVLISRQRTSFVSAGTFVRLIVILVFVVWAVSSEAIAGIEVASLTWTGGIAIEGLIVLGSLFLAFGSPAHAAAGAQRRNDRELTVRYVFGFFLPLAVMVTLRGALQPLIQAGIARAAPETTHALAVYGVTWSLVLNVAAPLMLLHNVAMVYATGRDHPSWPHVLRFCTATGTVITAVLIALAITPLGEFLFERVLGVSPAIASEANDAVLAFSLLPLFWSVREAYWGIMMRSHRTRSIGTGKVINIVTVVIAMLALFGLIARLVAIPPSVAGALALTCGEIAETVFVARRARREGDSGGRPTSES